MPTTSQIQGILENFHHDSHTANEWNNDLCLAYKASRILRTTVTKGFINFAMNKLTNGSCDTFDGTNSTGIYHIIHNKTHYYLFTKQMVVKPPITESSFFKEIDERCQGLLLDTRTCPETSTQLTTPAVHIDEDCQGLLLETRTQITERQTAHPAIPTITSSRKRKSPNTDLHSSPLMKRRKQRLIPSPANFACSKVEPKYSPMVDVKSVYKVSWMKSHETVQNKSTRILRRKLNTVHKRLNMVEKQLIDKTKTIVTLITERKKYHTMILCDRIKLMYIVKKLKKKECQESDYRKLIKRIGKIQANRASKEKKLECLITEAMKVYRTKTLPKELLRKNIRTYYRYCDYNITIKAETGIRLYYSGYFVYSFSLKTSELSNGFARPHQPKGPYVCSGITKPRVRARASRCYVQSVSLLYYSPRILRTSILFYVEGQKMESNKGNHPIPNETYNGNSSSCSLNRSDGKISNDGLSFKTFRSFRKVRRSRSAPAGYGRKKERQLLLEHHYRIDQQNRVLLPGIPSQDPDFARDAHDFFNLICLVPLIALNVMNWKWNSLLSLLLHKTEIRTTTKTTYSKGVTGSYFGSGIEGAWNGEYFLAFWYCTVGYFVLDLLWVCIIPRCVKSPTTIIQHHIATLLYLLVPFLLPEFQCYMGVCMSVEVNTWFLIARRVFNKQGFEPWMINLPYLFSVRVKLISIFFYITWVTTRCIIYPMMMIRYYELYMMRFRKGSTINIMLMVAIIHSIFCILNARWTWDLCQSKIRQWKMKSETKIEKGL